MLKWLLVGLLVFLVFRLVTRTPRYGKIFSPNHLMELSRGLGRARDAAKARVGKPPPEDPFAEGIAFITSADIAVAYTIAKADKGGFEHHISLSHRGGHFARAAGGFLAAAILRMLGVAGWPCVLAQSTTGVYHLILPIEASDAERFSSRPVPALDEAAAVELQRLAMDERDALLSKIGTIDVKAPS